MDRGFIKIFRKLADNPLWLQKPFSDGQAWVDLLMVANHKPGIISKRGQRVKVERGQVGYSVKGLADRWGWSRGKVDRFLIYLEGGHQIEQQKNNVTTLITLTNYETYNVVDIKTDTKRTPNEHQTDTNKKGKNEEKVKKKTVRFAPPSIEDVKAYCQQRGNSVDPERFINHYTSNGWMVGKNKMKDWKAAVGTWEKSSFKKQADKKKPSAMDVLDEMERIVTGEQ